LVRYPKGCKGSVLGKELGGREERCKANSCNIGIKESPTKKGKLKSIIVWIPERWKAIAKKP